MSQIIWILREFVAHSSDVTCLKLGPSNTQLLATGGKDMKVNLWSLDSINCRMTMSGHESPLESLGFHKSGTKLGGGCTKGVFKIWDLQNAKLTHTFSNHKSTLKCIEFHDYGEFAATGSADNQIKLWDLRRKGCIMTYKGHSRPITCISFSPDGRWLASADDDGAVKIWNMATHKQLCQLDEHKHPVNSLQFHPTELLMATSSIDSSIKLWDLDEKKLLTDINLEESEGQIKTVMFDSDGSKLFSLTSKNLYMHGWEPTHCYATVDLSHPNTKHAIISNNQMICAEFKQNTVTTFVIDIDNIPSNDRICKSSLDNHRKTFVGQIPPSHLNGKQIKAQSDPDDKKEVEGQVEVKDNDFLKMIGKINKVDRFSSPGGDSKDSDKKYQKELEILENLSSEHKKTIESMRSRNRNLQIIKREWIDKNVKSAVTTAVSLRDDSAIVDLLHILLGDVNLWNLDICQLLLPILYDLMFSKHEEYFHISLSTLRLIGHTFGPVIRSNMQAPPSPNDVDINRQDRYFKCKSCHKTLNQIYDLLSKQRNVITTGRLGVKIREMFELIGRIFL